MERGLGMGVGTGYGDRGCNWVLGSGLERVVGMRVGIIGGWDGG